MNTELASRLDQWEQEHYDSFSPLMNSTARSVSASSAGQAIDSNYTEHDFPSRGVKKVFNDFPFLDINVTDIEFISISGSGVT